ASLSLFEVKTRGVLSLALGSSGFPRPTRFFVPTVPVQKFFVSADPGGSRPHGTNVLASSAQQLVNFSFTFGQFALPRPARPHGLDVPLLRGPPGGFST
ncbi:hypothetical protein KI387_013073, partial [Taxus chinensis]